MTSKILPVYLVLQTSQSMNEHIDKVNEAVLAVSDEFALNPRASDVAALSIIAFSDEAHLVQPMTPLDQIEAIPVFKVGGSANYGVACTFLRRRINLDIQHLRVSGIRAMRPIVFFVGNGKAIDEPWRDEAVRLKDPSWSLRPHIVSISVDSSNGEWLSDIATASWLATDTRNVTASLANIVSGLVQTLITSIVDSPTGPARLGTVSIDFIDGRIPIPDTDPEDLC